MAASSYSPSSWLIVWDLYSVSFSDGPTAEDHWSGLLYKKKFTLKAVGGSSEKVTEKGNRGDMDYKGSHVPGR